MEKAATKAAEAALPQSSAAPAPLPAAALRPMRGAALWACVGFVAGAIVWHAVGFWTFMSDLVHGEEASAQSTAIDTSTLETGSLPVIYRIDPASCTSLELDRVTRRTVTRPCPRDGLELRLESADRREDLAFAIDDSLR